MAEIVNTHVLTIAPTGEINGLYTEIIPLTTLGSLHVQRLSNVEFNDTAQHWEVKDQAGVVVFTDASRQTCLEWEIQHFNQ
ncbi:MAG: hypothetical protein QOE70_3831 [Chthoniobacter sp.]|jgi:hypothetical protein|nr:hypothetical protein [Chthoniobacter sp.]